MPETYLGLIVTFYIFLKLIWLGWLWIFVVVVVTFYAKESLIHFIRYIA